MSAQKTCASCGEPKELEAFSAGRAVCKPCRSVESKAWYRNNPEKVALARPRRALAARIWARDNPARAAANSRRHREANPKRASECTRAWQKRNPEKHAATSARGRAKRAQASPSWASGAAVALMYLKAREWGMTVDHVVPLRSPIVCGLHCEANLQLLAFPENSRKNNRVWPDMPGEHP